MKVNFYVNSKQILRFIQAVRDEDFEGCAELDIHTYQPSYVDCIGVSLDGEQAEALILNMMPTSSNPTEWEFPF